VMVPVEGAVKSMDAKNLTFRWDERDNQAERANVFAVRYAAGDTKYPKACGTIIGPDGTTVSFSSLSVNDQTVTIDTLAMGKKSFPVKNVAVMRLVSDRVTGLGDLKPSAQVEKAYFDHVLKYRVNASVGGKPIMLGGKTYRTGLGLHSFCELTYDLDGKYTRFVTIAGIDDAVRPIGDADLTILGDDKPIGQVLRVTGKSDPADIKLDVTGVKKLTIRVDFGQDKLDAGDDVDLAGARLIK
jgi:hypothetical protein